MYEPAVMVRVNEGGDGGKSRRGVEGKMGLRFKVRSPPAVRPVIERQSQRNPERRPALTASEDRDIAGWPSWP